MKKSEPQTRLARIRETATRLLWFMRALRPIEPNKWVRLWWFLSAREYDRLPWWYWTGRLTWEPVSQWPTFPFLHATIDIEPEVVPEKNTKEVALWRLNVRFLAWVWKPAVSQQPFPGDPGWITYLVNMIGLGFLMQWIL